MTTTDLEPAAWMYAQKDDSEIFVAMNRPHMDPRYWTETALYTADQIAALIEERDRLRALVDGASAIFENCVVESGTCCCGDDTMNHSSPMFCGHSPVDSGAYQVSQWQAELAGEKP